MMELGLLDGVRQPRGACLMPMKLVFFCFNIILVAGMVHNTKRRGIFSMGAKRRGPPSESNPKGGWKRKVFFEILLVDDKQTIKVRSTEAKEIARQTRITLTDGIGEHIGNVRLFSIWEHSRVVPTL
jgi:hypothetical protein